MDNKKQSAEHSGKILKQIGKCEPVQNISGSLENNGNGAFENYNIYE